MAKKENFDDMPITKVVKQWMDGEEWKDDIKINDDRSHSTVATTVSLNDQVHQLFLEADEKTETFDVFMYTPVNAPPARMADMARILNRINRRLLFGRLACFDDQDSNPVQFFVRIDVEGGTLATMQITNMFGAAYQTLTHYGQLLAATALTKQSAGSLWAEFLEQEAAEEATSKEADEESGPSEL